MSDKNMWTAFCGNEIGKFDNFKDAVKAVFDEVKKSLHERTMSYQILETATWVVADGLPVMFYEMRDIACDLKWIENGEWTA